MIRPDGGARVPRDVDLHRALEREALEHARGVEAVVLGVHVHVVDVEQEAGPRALEQRVEKVSFAELGSPGCT
jgi:hypothetical protein